jgi:hypothetical protein
MHENRETSIAPAAAGRSGKAQSHNPDVYAGEESDSAVVPVKQPNKEVRISAEAVEGRAQAEENVAEPSTSPTRSGERVSQGLGGVRRAAQARKRRVYIPKADGRQRPLGIATLEDKIVQQAMGTILSQIYEADFRGFSYGFRPGRSPHQALDALNVGLQRKRVNWILDADIRGFFDNMDHEWMMKFVGHRVADPRVLRLIRKWLKAGVSEDGTWSETKVGTPQGAGMTA